MFKVNDSVHSFAFGYGIVTSLDDTKDFPIRVMFGFEGRNFTKEGKHFLKYETEYQHEYDIFLIKVEEVIYHFPTYQKAYEDFINSKITLGKNPTNFGIVNHLGEHEMVDDIRGYGTDIPIFKKDYITNRVS